MEKESIYQMKLGKIYPLLVQKAVRKGRTQAEVDTVICWLTGYSREELCALAQGAISYGDFFRQAACAACGWKRFKNRCCRRSAAWTS